MTAWQKKKKKKNPSIKLSKTRFVDRFFQRSASLFLFISHTYETERSQAHAHMVIQMWEKGKRKLNEWNIKKHIRYGALVHRQEQHKIREEKTFPLCATMHVWSVFAGSVEVGGWRWRMAFWVSGSDLVWSGLVLGKRALVRAEVGPAESWNQHERNLHKPTRMKS